jgi:hypothetical protein
VSLSSIGSDVKRDRDELAADGRRPPGTRQQTARRAHEADTTSIANARRDRRRGGRAKMRVMAADRPLSSSSPSWSWHREHRHHRHHHHRHHHHRLTSITTVQAQPAHAQNTHRLAAHPSVGVPCRRQLHHRCLICVVGALSWPLAHSHTHARSKHL